MAVAIVMSVTLYLVGGVVFGGLAWLVNRILRDLASTRTRAAAVLATAALPLAVPVVMTLAALRYDPAALQDPKTAVILMTFLPLVAPAAVGGVAGARGRKAKPAPGPGQARPASWA